MRCGCSPSARGRPSASARGGLTAAGLARTEDFHVACVRLEPGGLAGRHPAVSDQLSAVVEGSGWVASADDERHPIATGEAAVWHTGEEHEAGTDSGLVAIVVEAEELA